MGAIIATLNSSVLKYTEAALQQCTCLRTVINKSLYPLELIMHAIYKLAVRCRLSYVVIEKEYYYYFIIHGEYE